VLAAYWFLLLSPKREEATRLGGQLSTHETRRDAIRGDVDRLNAAQAQYAADYATVVRLGKAIPPAVDMPSLLVQLDRAASGTRIEFDKISTGARLASAESGSSSSGSSPGTAGTAGAAGSGQSTQQQGQNAAPPSGASGSSGAPAEKGGKPGARGSGVAGLDAVPLEFTLRGGFFELADFFRELKRFVRVAGGDRISVEGRLVTIDGFELKTTRFPAIEATVNATVYLSPKVEGATAGATPSGPRADAAGSAQPSGNPASIGSAAR
jgi:hypothetical protein